MLSPVLGGPLRRAAVPSSLPLLRAVAGAVPAPLLPLPQLAARNHLLPQQQRRDLCAAMDPETPDPERVLDAELREGTSQNPELPAEAMKWPTGTGSVAAEKLRKLGRIPAVLSGDWLPHVSIHVDLKEMNTFWTRPHFQRELLTLRINGGETVKVLPQDVSYDNLKNLNLKHINFRRWPRDPVRNPVKLAVPLIFINSEVDSTIKNGGYVHNMFAAKGLPCRVSDEAHVPRFIVGDYKRARDGDLRFNDLDMPPGVTVRPTKITTLNNGNFLVARSKRVRGG